LEVGKSSGSGSKSISKILVLSKRENYTKLKVKEMKMYIVLTLDLKAGDQANKVFGHKRGST
jgi:hypothetical protein